MSRFNVARLSDWCIRQTMSDARRSRLLRRSSFESIIASLRNELELLTVRRGHKGKKLFRVECTLLAKRVTVDVFHSARFGYRAQFYSSERMGELANEYALKRLGPTISALIETAGKRTCESDWVKKSLAAPGAKLWIYQGQWLRTKKRSSRNLRVERWGKISTKPYKDAAKKRVWGQLTPWNEIRLDVKGGWIYRSGATPKTPILKKYRSAEIRDLGFT